MASRNGDSVFDIVTKSYERTVLSLNNDGTLATSLPAEICSEFGISAGDSVVVKKSDKPGVVELYFE